MTFLRMPESTPYLALIIEKRGLDLLNKTMFSTD
jgi:hypothetical protein